MMARNFFKEVFLARNIEAIAGNFNGPAVVCARRAKTKAVENPLHNGIVYASSQDSFDSLTSQCSHDLPPMPGIDVNHIPVKGATREFPDQDRCTVACEPRHFHIGSALKAV